jgi:protein-L-isoaspartate(D-aspartate) O-methyltransferase
LNVTVVTGDSTGGLPKHAPYDRICVTAAGPDVPEPLVDKLKDGGRMVVPIGMDWQTLYFLEKRDDTVSKMPHSAVRFVPLIGEHGLESDEA